VTDVEQSAPVREVLRWEDTGTAARELAVQVRESGFDPEVVVAIARGGLLVGGALAYALGVKSCGSINVELYTGVDETLPEPLLLPPHMDGSYLDGRRVLLADDVSQSGLTLRLAVDILKRMGADVRTACFYTKPQTVFVPDYSWRETDKWIVFPWSAEPPVMGMGPIGSAATPQGRGASEPADGAPAE
jgi:hypoxanthine phosphoribosyltransferase